MLIKLEGGGTTEIDDEDYPRVAKYKWRLWEKKGQRYAVSTNYLKMHRLIVGAPRNKQVDHINRNGLDNRRSNLRLCTNSQNSMNRKTRARSGYKGVYSRTPGWVAMIEKDNVKHYCGYFDDPMSAALAYDKAATQLFGEFARTNFTPEVQS